MKSSHLVKSCLLFVSLLTLIPLAQALEKQGSGTHALDAFENTLIDPLRVAVEIPAGSSLTRSALIAELAGLAVPCPTPFWSPELNLENPDSGWIEFQATAESGLDGPGLAEKLLQLGVPFVCPVKQTPGAFQSYLKNPLMVLLPYHMEPARKEEILRGIPGMKSYSLTSSPASVRFVPLGNPEGDPEPQTIPADAREIYTVELNSTNGFDYHAAALELNALGEGVYAEPNVTFIATSAVITHPDFFYQDPPSNNIYELSFLSLLGFRYTSPEWRHHPAYGHVYGSQSPYFYHETHGWQYGSADSSVKYLKPSSGEYQLTPFFIRDCWLYDYTSQSWWWTSLDDGGNYPWIFREQKWYLYLQGTHGPRWFYDAAAQAWVNF